MQYQVRPHSGPFDPTPTGILSGLLEDVIDLRSEVIRDARVRLAPYAKYYTDAYFPYSAQNLAHYLSFRHRDLRPLQGRLARAGLSSLGRSESHVLSTLDQVANILGRALGAPIHASLEDQDPSEAYTRAEQLMEEHTQHLFGPRNSNRDAYIMVTLPNEAAYDVTLVQALVSQGMDCARINCAHGDEVMWEAMATNVRQAAAATGRSCKILIDLVGHKIRTGPLETLPPVKHVKIKRNSLGQKTAPGKVFLYREGTAPAGQLSLPGEIFENLQPGDQLSFKDTRGKKRCFYINQHTASGSAGSWLAGIEHSAYVAANSDLTWERLDENGKYHTIKKGRFGIFLGEQVRIHLKVGDTLLLKADISPGQPAVYNEDGQLQTPASIGCTHPEVIRHLEEGELVWIDDGKLGGVVMSIDENGALLSIAHARDKGANVQAEKGLNFPHSHLNLPPLSEKDLHDLEFVCQQADMVGFSFVESLSDMEYLMAELAKRGKPELPIIVKVETPRAVRHLPDILLGTLGRHVLGVMIARGDLAVELGGVRLAEIQEEILWLCEAAHVPVIWATQVLERLAKEGSLSRPEYTDAAMSGRAECVMLNKGPHILDAVHELDEVLQRMQCHQHKKTARLRALHW
jgi:pyruvate kinase